MPGWQKHEGWSIIGSWVKLVAKIQFDQPDRFKSMPGQGDMQIGIHLGVAW